jgi:cyclopropane-fatty-acyl-phospholipid synthase
MAESIVRDLFARVGVSVGGDAPHDPQVHDSRFYRRLLRDGSLGLGESYVEGWWDAESVDSFLCRILAGRLDHHARRNLKAVGYALAARVLDLQGKRLASRDVRGHYERGLDLFRIMLDPSMAYSCGYWRDADTLEDAQEAKFNLTCRKLGLQPGMTFLDIGCGWGSLLHHAAAHFGVRAVGITLSPEQAEVARERCRGLPVEVRVMDYRDLPVVGDSASRQTESFEAIASIGMFEHVGARHYRGYMEVVARCLAPGGVTLLHTIAGNERTPHIDPWLHRYIFPGSNLPAPSQIAEAAEGIFLIEDVHNFGPDYDRTLLAWHDRFETGWPRLRERYDERFRRIWRYYLLSCAGAFRARHTQLLQFVLTRPGDEHPRRFWEVRE